MFFDLLKIVVLALNTIILILIAVAYFTLAERKVMAAIQRRLGPNINTQTIIHISIQMFPIVLQAL